MADAKLNLSMDARDPNRLYIDGRPPPRQLQPQGDPSRSRQSHPKGSSPFPQALDNQPDLLVISYPQVPEDSKPTIAETIFSTPMSAPPLGRWH